MKIIHADTPVIPPYQNMQTKYRVQAIRKNILNDVLTYNKQTSQMHQRIKLYRRQTQKRQQQRQKQQLQKQQILQEKLQQKRKQSARQLLQQTLNEQIKYKEQIKQRQKHRQIIYAQNEKEYLQYQETRRMGDILRMYKRNSFQVVRKDLGHRRIKTQLVDQHNQEQKYYNMNNAASLQKYKDKHVYTQNPQSHNIRQQTPQKRSSKLNLVSVSDIKINCSKDYNNKNQTPKRKIQYQDILDRQRQINIKQRQIVNLYPMNRRQQTNNNFY